MAGEEHYGRRVRAGFVHTIRHIDRYHICSLFFELSLSLGLTVYFILSLEELKGFSETSTG